MALFRSSAQPAPVQPSETPATDALISLRNIEKSYAHGASRTFVLRRINVDIKEGEFVSIMGPSGAGKSTLLHIIGHARQRLDRRVLLRRPAGAPA